jgi:hypothetical protein
MIPVMIKVMVRLLPVVVEACFTKDRRSDVRRPESGQTATGTA